ncbi:DNRLRE domain-containing protein [Syntrophomonas erecta subsp. sporosyntropha]
MASITLLPIQDTYIAEWYPESNFRGTPALFVSRYLQPGDGYRSILQFDLDNLPSTSTIEKAELELTMYRNEVSSHELLVEIHDLLFGWNKNLISWSNQPDHNNIPVNSIIVKSDTSLGKLLIYVTKLVKGWYDGSIPNNGLILIGNENINSLVAFRSTNFTNSFDWPRLHVSFVDGILNSYDVEQITIPDCPEVPIITSTPVFLGARKQATFLVANQSDSSHVKAMVQVSYSHLPGATYFDVGNWVPLKRHGYVGEAVALSTYEAAEYVRVLVTGSGGETVKIYPRTREI